MTVEERMAANDPLARWAVKKYCRLSETDSDYEDAVQEARIAMLRAARTYQEGKGAQFSTWATVCIMHQLSAWGRRRHKYGFHGSSDTGDFLEPLQLTMPKDADLPVHDEWHTDHEQDAIGDADRTEAVWYAVRRLAKVNKVWAKAVYGRYYLRLSSVQLAEWLDISRTHLTKVERQARALLARWLTEQM